MQTHDYNGYIPRKCSYTGQLITISDRASIQLSIKKENHKKNNSDIKTFVICGKLRRQGKSDAILNQLFENEDE